MSLLPRLDHPNAYRPIPRMLDYPTRPMTGPGIFDDEPLVAITHVPGVVSLNAYREAGYEEAPDVMMVRFGARMALAKAVKNLPSGYSLGVWDAWRPLELQRTLYSQYVDNVPEGMVAEPSADPLNPPPHLTGGTVDVTLVLMGAPLELGTGFDGFNADAHTSAWEGKDDAIRDHRRVLFWAMRDAGFVAHPQEWWHYEIGTLRFAQIDASPPWYGPASYDPNRSLA